MARPEAGETSPIVAGARGDNPITTRSQDLLNRAHAAEQIALDVRAVDASQGYVMAVMGPWGSGKTSLVNLVKENLRQEEPPVPVIDFNPWMFSGTDVLVNSFFREVSAQLREKSQRDYGGLADQLDRYSELLTPLVWLPVVGPWAGRVKSLAGAAKRFKDKSQESVSDSRDRLSQGLARLQHPLLVVVDDIDRLSRQEIQDIFKLVRLTASFPNIVYLLVFDRARVEEALSVDGMPGRSYLEKIVQSGHDLPAVPTSNLLRQIGESLQEVIDGVGGVDLFDDTRWPDVLMEVISPLVRNIRDVRRYAASTRPTVAYLREQIDLVDLFAMEAVRVFLPDVFWRLVEAQEALTKPTSYYVGGTDYEAPRLKAQIEDVFQAAGPRRSLVEDLIRRVFPAGVRHFENNSYGSDWLKTWLKGRRMAHIDVLRLYFERTASEAMAAFIDAERSLSLMPDGPTFRAFLDSLPVERLEDVISALETFEGDFPEEGVVPGVTALLDVLPKIPEKPRGMFTLDTRLVVSRVVLRLLRQLPNEAQTERAVDEILASLQSLSSKLELVGLVGHVERLGHKLVSEQKAVVLQDALVQEIRSADAEELSSEWDLLSVLLAPRHLGSGDPRRIAEDAPVALHTAVFRSALSETRGQSVNSRHVRRTQTLQWEALLDIYGSEDAIRSVAQRMKVEGTGSSDDLLEVTERYLSGWRPDHDD